MRHALHNGSWKNSQGNTQDFLWFTTFVKNGMAHMRQVKSVDGDIYRDSHLMRMVVHIQKTIMI
jgi:hypothetical protein